MKSVSIVSIVYGTFGLVWATITIVLIRLQSALLGNFPWPEETYEYVDMPVLLDTVFSVVGTLFPFVFLIALLYIVSGTLQLSGKSSFKNLAFAAAILNIIWYLAYVVLIQLEIVPVLSSMEIFPNNLINILVIAGMIINGVFYCAYPVFLIIFLKHGGKEWDTLETEYKT